MDIVSKLIGVVGGILSAVGIYTAWTGFLDWNRGRKNDNPNKVDSGIDAMISGGAMTLVSAGAAAGIITALNAIHW